MSDFKKIVDEEMTNMKDYAEKLFIFEMKFRKYVSEKELSEESYKLAADDYHEEVVELREKIEETAKNLNTITENTNYTVQDDIDELNMILGKTIRIIVANLSFVKDYAGQALTDDPNEINEYKEIYDKHLDEAKEFMYYFIKVCNLLCSK